MFTDLNILNIVGVSRKPFFKFLADTCPFWGPLVPLFWISGWLPLLVSKPESVLHYSLFYGCKCKVYTFPEIHLWCYICWPLGGWQLGWSLSHIHQQRWDLAQILMGNHPHRRRTNIRLWLVIHCTFLSSCCSSLGMMPWEQWVNQNGVLPSPCWSRVLQLWNIILTSATAFSHRIRHFIISFLVIQIFYKIFFMFFSRIVF